MTEDIDENIDVLTKLIQDIKSTDDKHIDEYFVIVVVLLNVIPQSCNDLKDAIEYGHDSITIDIVGNALRSKERELKYYNNCKNNEKVMHARGRTQYKNPKHEHNKDNEPK